MTEKTDTPDAEKPESGNLDKLLAEYNAEPKKASEPDPQVAQLLERENRRDLNSVVAPKMKGDLDVDDDLALGYLFAKAAKDKDLEDKFQNRHENPGEWDKALDGVSTEFQEKMGTSKKSDDGGLAAAANMARESKTPSDPFEGVDWNALSDTELAMKKSQVFKALKAGTLK